MNLIFRSLMLMIVISLTLISVHAQDGTTDFVEASVDRTSAYYVGEPILYTWRWFLETTNIDIATNDSDVRLPSFAGFGQEPLDISVESAIRNGKTYQVITQQIVLYYRYASMQQTITLDPVRIVIPETPFTQGQTLQSPPVEVIIQPVPPNAPETFINAVGQFDLRASMDRFEAKTGELLLLTMTITGSGNGPVMYPPRLEPGSEWRHYVKDVIRRQDGPLLGEVIFTWTLIPLTPGPLTIPSQSWSYLNPQTAQYETRATQPFTINVSGEPMAIIPEAASMPDKVRLPPLHYVAGINFHGRDSIAIYESLIWHHPSGITVEGMACAVIPALIAGAIWGVGALSRQKQTQGQKQTQKRKRSSVFQDRLAALGHISPHDAAREIQVVLREALQQRQRSSSTDIESLIQDLPSDLQSACRSCFETATFASYAPFTAEDANHLIQETQQLIRRLEVS